MKLLSFLFLFICIFSQMGAQNLNWGTPVTLSVSTTDNASDPEIVMDSNGNITVAWVENGVVYSSVQSVGGSFSTPVAISNTGASSPQLAWDDSGKVTAVWIENGYVKTATLPLNGSWSSASILSAAGASSPVLAVDAGGDAVAVWVRSGYIEASSKVSGGSWSLIVTVLSAANSDHPDVAIGTNGRVVAVWHTTSISGSDMIYSATQLVGGTWSSAISILPVASAFSQNYPAVSVDPFGNADVIWYRYFESNGEYSGVFVYSSSFSVASLAWSLPLQISETGIRNPGDLTARISTDSAGNKIALWGMSYDNSTFNLETATKPLGGSWSAVSSLVTKGLYSFTGDLAVNQLGGVAYSYMYFDGTSALISSLETNTQGILSSPYLTQPITISSGTMNGYPRIDSSYNGNMLYAGAVWLSSNGSYTTLQAATGSRTPVAAPTNVAVVQNSLNFGVFQDYYNTVTWSPSATSNVVEYAVYRDGNLCAQIGANQTLQYVDHNDPQSATVTYGIVALDDELSQSQVVYISHP